MNPILILLFMIFLELVLTFMYGPQSLTLLGLSGALKCQDLCDLCIQSLFRYGLLLTSHRCRSGLLCPIVEIIGRMSGRKGTAVTYGPCGLQMARSNVQAHVILLSMPQHCVNGRHYCSHHQIQTITEGSTKAVHGHGCQGPLVTLETKPVTTTLRHQMQSSSVSCFCIILCIHFIQPGSAGHVLMQGRLEDMFLALRFLASLYSKYLGISPVVTPKMKNYQDSSLLCHLHQGMEQCNPIT